ncbi:MAG: endolytic transglycosylase MltG [Candidatus Zixiibacteriota bacterium]
MRKLILKLLAVVIIIIAGYLTFAYLYPVDIGEQVVTVVIEPGDSFRAVGMELLDKGVVKSKTMLFYPAKLRAIDKKLVPGRYDFTGKNSCRSVLDKLEQGEFIRIRLTVYEGVPIWRVASLLQEKLNLDSAELIALNTDEAFLQKLDLPYLEGYLYPETYFIPWGMKLEKVVEEMVAMFHARTDTVWTDSNYNNLSREEVVVLASIVEAETTLDDEKPLVASVYHNRLKKRMKLDADPTVIYGLGGVKRSLSKKDLRQDSPYNTYRYKGLPPTPINSPDLEAIRAVLHPDSTDYLFFVADGTGGHRFSRTNSEHNRARQEIKQTLELKTSGNN